MLIKVSNTVGTPANMTFTLPFKSVKSSGTAEVLTGAGTASNTPSNPDLVTPKKYRMTMGATFNYTAPAFSVSVLTVHTH